MEYFAAIFFVCCFTVGLLRLAAFGTEKVIEAIANPIIARHERREWHKLIMRSLRRKRKEQWKRETVLVALDFSLPARLTETNEKCSGKGA